MLCVWWDQKGAELLKPGEAVNTKRYQEQLTDLNRSLLEKRTERGLTEKDNENSFFFMTMLQHSAVKFYLVQPPHQTWLLPITTCLHR